MTFLSWNRGGSRTAATSKMEHFVIIVNSWKPLTIITKSSILDVAAVLDPPLRNGNKVNHTIWWGWPWDFKFHNENVCLVYISYSDQYQLLDMYYSSCIDYFSSHANLCAQKSWKHTFTGFNPVTPLQTLLYLQLFFSKIFIIFDCCLS